MKILHIITSLKIGGAESALYNLLSELQKNKNNQHFVAYFYEGLNVEKIKCLGVPVFQIKGSICRYDPIAYLKLKRLVKKIKPDVIHSALWMANIFARLVSRSLNIPIVCDLHSNFEHDGKLRIFIEKKLSSFLVPDQYIAVSNSAKNGFIKSVVDNISNKSLKDKLTAKILLVQNGIDLEGLRVKAKENNLTKRDLGFDENDFIIGAVGRLDPIKNYGLLIKAFKLFCTKIKDSNLKKVKLCIIGDGSQKTELEELVNKLKITEKIFFAGWRSDAYNFYPLFDCFVLSSFSEGLSIALLEALCFGLPIITTNQGCEHDVVIDGQNGFLVPSGREELLAGAIEKLYKDPELILKMRKTNYKLIKSYFTISRQAGCYQGVYSSLLEKNKTQ